ncbi:hypothetical protein [Hymenobacter sp. DG01]|uniref:hypothetical protein n=1 Tax=Hymenobacter sp. DG01 TaxID=2584940 RepID=UPI0011221D2F|nr:hypothetical protein [Hymenobacter sp. DG01]
MASQDTHDPRWLDYLFRRHSRAELGTWARRLQYFRFCKAIGGHANDGDQLLVALHYTDEADIRQLLAQLGVAVDSSSGFPQFARRVMLAGQQVWLRAQKPPEPRLEISLFDQDNPYEVTTRTVAAAEAVEKILGFCQPRIIDPPWLAPHCVCPAYYPELWTDTL